MSQAGPANDVPRQGPLFSYTIYPATRQVGLAGLKAACDTTTEGPLIPCPYLMKINNYKRKTLPNDSLNQAHPIVVVQAKP